MYAECAAVTAAPLHTHTRTPRRASGAPAYEVTPGVLAADAVALLQTFYSRGNKRTQAPQTAVEAAQSGDALVAESAAPTQLSRAPPIG